MPANVTMPCRCTPTINATETKALRQLRPPQSRHPHGRRMLRMCEHTRHQNRKLGAVDNILPLYEGTAASLICVETLRDTTRYDVVPRLLHVPPLLAEL